MDRALTIKPELLPTIVPSTTPAKCLLPNKWEWELVEGIFGQWTVGRGEAVQVAAGMICLDCPAHFIRLARLPRDARWSLGQHFRASVAELGVRRVDVYATKAPIRRHVPAGHTTAVEHRCCSWCPPRRVEVPVVVCPAFCVRIDGAQLLCTHSWLHTRALAGVAYHPVRPDLVAPSPGRRNLRRAAATRNRTPRAAVTHWTTDRAAVGEPKARLPVLARDFAVAVRCRAPACLGLNRRAVARLLARWRAVPGRKVTINGIARRWVNHSTMRHGTDDAGGQDQKLHGEPLNDDSQGFLASGNAMQIIFCFSRPRSIIPMGSLSSRHIALSGRAAKAQRGHNNITINLFFIDEVIHINKAIDHSSSEIVPTWPAIIQSEFLSNPPAFKDTLLG